MPTPKARNSKAMAAHRRNAIRKYQKDRRKTNRASAKKKG